MKKPSLLMLPLFLLAAFALLSCACGAVQQAKDRVQRQNDLKQIGIAYFNYCDVNRKGPANADDLLKLQPETAAALVRERSGEFKIIWGVNLSDVAQFTNGSSQTVLGYESKTLVSGGAVLYADGAVRQETAADFAKMTQAKPSTGIKK